MILHSHQPLTYPALTMPDAITGGWGYFTACALFFTLSGLVCGYFIWRKGNMQMQDAELEVKRTAEELQALREDLSEEERGIRLEEDESAVSKIVPPSN